jgi:hypothetical protein
MEINESEKPCSNFWRNNLELLRKSFPLGTFSNENRDSKKIDLDSQE